MQKFSSKRRVAIGFICYLYLCGFWTKKKPVGTKKGTKVKEISEGQKVVKDKDISILCK